MPERTVEGTISLPASDVPGRAVEVVVQVEDVSRADAPSVVVGEQRLRDVSLVPGGTLTFAIPVSEQRIDPRGSYSVRAHVDVDGTGRVAVGDLLTVQSFPVLTRGHPDRVAVTVRKI